MLPLRRFGYQSKLELSSPNANNYLHIEPRYLSAFLTPSPSDITMGSPSPIDIISMSIDIPDTVLCKKPQNVISNIEAREQFISAIPADNGNAKYIARAPAYPGQAKQIVVASKNGIAQIMEEVGSLFDEHMMKPHQSESSTNNKFVLEESHGTYGVKSIVEMSMIKDKIDVEQKEVSNFKRNTENMNIELGGDDHRKIIVQIESGLSNCALEEISKSKLKDVKSKETYLRSETEIVDVDLNTSDGCEVKIQPNQLNSNKLALDHRSTEDLQDKVESHLSSKTEIIDKDLGSSEVINLKTQPVYLDSKLATKENRVSIIEHMTIGKIDVGQKEVSDLRTKMEITNVDLGSDFDDIMETQSSRSNELRLSECCWPTRGNTANDKIEISGRDITFQKEIVDLGSNYSIDEPQIVEKVCSDQVSISQIALEKDYRLIENITKRKKTDISKEINFKKETSDTKPYFINTSNIIRIQPSHSNHNIKAVKGNSILKTTKAKTELDKRKTRSEEHLELSKLYKDDEELNKFYTKKIIKDIEVDIRRINHEKENSDLKAKIMTSSPNVSITSLDGRHECALSDFSVDKKNYWLSQYGENKSEKEDKSLYTKSNVTNYIISQRKDMIDDIVNFTNDNKISSKRNNDQVLTNVISHKEKSKDSITNETDDSIISSEELFLSKCNAKKSSLEVEKDDKFDIENGKNGKRIKEAFKTLQKTDKVSKREKGLELDVQSLEKQMTSCDLEIDGKYLKSIVNSRKSPRKIKEDQIRDDQTKMPKNQQTIQSEVFQDFSVKIKSFMKNQVHDIDAEAVDAKDKDQIINDQEISNIEKIFQNSSKSTSTKIKNPEEAKELETHENDREFNHQYRSIDNEKISRIAEVLKNSSKITSTKTKSFKKVEGLQVDKDDSKLFKNNDKSISNRETSQSGAAFQKFSRTSSMKSSKNIKEKQIRHRSGEMKDYDRLINDCVISQLEQVFQNSSRKSSMEIENPSKNSKDCIEAKAQTRSVDDQETSKEFSQHSSKMFSMKSPKKVPGQKDVKMNDKKIIDDRTKQNFNEIKDVYTRKVRRYNVPFQGSLDSMIESDESFARKPKKEDVFSKKSKSYESIKRIQEVFLGMPSKTASSGSQLDIPDEFCSICCYMNEITFRTEEEISSPNQETFYTLRSAYSSADDDDSIECDICSSLNLQTSDNIEDKILVGSVQEEIPCELCRICGEVDSSFGQEGSVVPVDKYIFKVIEPSQEDDDNFEIENCGFQSGMESADDRSRISEREKIKEFDKQKSQSILIHDSSVIKDPPRELYLIPKDEIAILTSGIKKVNRKGSLFKKKENLNEKVRDNRRYSSVDSLQLAKMSATAGDKVHNIAKNPMLVGSADNLQISWRDLKRSKSLQRSADYVDRLDSSIDNLNPLTRNLAQEEKTAQAPASFIQKPNIRDKEAVKMILTQHGIKIISEKETAL